MTPEEALQLLTQVCAGVQANLQTHIKMQEALETLRVAITPAAVPTSNGQASAPVDA